MSNIFVRLGAAVALALVIPVALLAMKVIKPSNSVGNPNSVGFYLGPDWQLARKKLITVTAALEEMGAYRCGPPSCTQGAIAVTALVRPQGRLATQIDEAGRPMLSREQALSAIQLVITADLLDKINIDELSESLTDIEVGSARGMKATLPIFSGSTRGPFVSFEALAVKDKIVVFSVASNAIGEEALTPVFADVERSIRVSGERLASEGG